MFNKKSKKAEQVDIWGEPTPENEFSKTTRPKALDKMESKIDALPTEQRNRRYIALTVGVVAVCLLVFIGAATTTCSTGKDISRQDAINSVFEETETSSTATPVAEPEDPTLYFANISALTNLSEDSQKKFATDFRAFATEKGNSPTERVMCYSRIEGSGNNSTFWVSCPSGKQYYQVDFNNDTKEFKFTECELPENLPEVNYEAIEAQKKAAEQGTTANTAAVPDTSANDTSNNTNNTVVAPITSTADVSTVWANNAVSILPAAVDGFAQSKGKTVDLSRTVVDLASATTTDGNTTAVIHCTDTSGSQYDIEATWDAAQNAFGMKLL